MKKSSLIKKASSRHTSLIKKIVPLLVVFLLAFFSYLVIPSIIKEVVKLAWYPFDSLRVWVDESNSSLPQYIRDRSALVAELNDLKIKVATEQGTENTIKKLEIENDEFRSRVGAVPENRILARVIGRPNRLPYDMLMLDRGSDNGIVEQAPVFLGKDQVIGFVSKVHAKTSLVTLVTTPGFSSSAYVIGPNIFTFADGMGGGVLRISVPQGILLHKGDLVVLPAIDSGVYGAVSEIVAPATQPEQYGYLTTSIPLQSLYYVTVGSEDVVTNNFTKAEEVVNKVKADLFKVNLPAGVLVTPETVASSTASTSIPRNLPVFTASSTLIN
jgi:cell shape-determining protein MreC